MQHKSRHALLRTIAALAVSAVMLGACGKEDTDEGLRRFEADAPGAREADEAGENASGGSEGSGGNGGSNGDGSGGSSKTAATKKRRPGIPDEGRYTYRVVTEGKEKPTERFFDVVDGEERDAGGFRQFLTWSVGDEATRFLVAQNDEGAIVEAEQRARGPEVATMCVWKPEYLDTPRNAEAGHSWTVSSACEADGTKRERTMESRVVAVQQQSLDGRSFRVLVITRKITTTTSSKDIQMGETEDYTDRYAPDLGLLISREGTRSTTLQGVPRPPVKSKMELTSLKKEPVFYDEDE